MTHEDAPGSTNETPERARPACEWCTRPLPPDVRRDALTCSKACRQAKQRFRVASAGERDGSPRHFAYADPPYPGKARRYYRCPEVDHAELIHRLTTSYRDGWALSTSAQALRDILPLCPAYARVCIWHRHCRGTRHIAIPNAYEVLIVAHGRPRRLELNATATDVLTWSGRQNSHPNALVGMKPAAFCEWMFRLLGARQGDTLDDLFPGSGAVTRAWKLHMSARSSATRPSRFLEARHIGQAQRYQLR